MKINKNGKDKEKQSAEPVAEQQQELQPVGEEQVALQSDKMRNKPIGKLLLEMSLPAIFSMLVQSLYNIVDSLFLTNITYVEEGYKGLNIGKDSFNAVSIVMPMTMFVTAVAIGIGVGANAYIARKLGEGNRESANKGAKTAIVMALFAWAIMAVMAFTLSRPFVQAFVNDGNATDVNYVVEKGTMYLTIYMAASGGVTLDIVSARILQATGNMKVPMISQLIGAVTNIVLDALFIMVFKMGVFGAILATVIGQWFAASFDLAFFIFKKQDVSISLKGFRFNAHYFARIAKIGLPALVMNAMSSVVTIILNVMLRSYTNGITVLSAYFKVQSFIFMPVFGLMQGTMPILSYNYGANLRKRFNSTFKLSLSIALGVMTLGTLLFQLCPELLMSIFESKTVSQGQTWEQLQQEKYAFGARRRLRFPLYQHFLHTGCIQHFADKYVAKHQLPRFQFAFEPFSSTHFPYPFGNTSQHVVGTGRYLVLLPVCRNFVNFGVYCFCDKRLQKAVCLQGTAVQPTFVGVG